MFEAQTAATLHTFRQIARWVFPAFAMIASLVLIAFAYLASPDAMGRTQLVFEGAEVILLTLAGGTIAGALYALSSTSETIPQAS